MSLQPINGGDIERDIVHRAMRVATSDILSAHRGALRGAAQRVAFLTDGLDPVNVDDLDAAIAELQTARENYAIAVQAAAGVAERIKDFGQ